MRILVTGATGFIGRRLVIDLHALGEDLLTLSRQMPVAPGVVGPIDLADIEAWFHWPR